MTGPASQNSGSSTGSRISIGARLWMALLASAALTTLVPIGAVLLFRETDAWIDTRTLLMVLAGAGGVGLLIAAITAAWLSSGIVGGVRRLRQDLTASHFTEPMQQRREWGEIRDVSAGVHALLVRQRQLVRTEAESARASADLARLFEVVERWLRHERWEPLRVSSPTISPLADGLNQGFARWSEIAEQNREVARSIRVEIAEAIEEARRASEGAEHGYVEATALQTTLHEITRLGGKLQAAISRRAPASPAVPAKPSQAWEEEAARSIEDLVGVSSDSVQHLGQGLLRVQEIAGQVELLSNRATLVALNALLAGARPRESGVERNTELRQLASDVRVATDRVKTLTVEIERDVEAANARMNAIRERTRVRLSDLQRSSAQALSPTPPPVDDDAAGILHLADRLREMVQDAVSKGQRLSETGEKSSRAAERLARHLEDALHDLDGLLARLAPPPVEELSPAQPPSLKLLIETDDSGMPGRERGKS